MLWTIRNKTGGDQRESKKENWGIEWRCKDHALVKFKSRHSKRENQTPLYRERKEYIERKGEQKGSYKRPN